MGKSTTFDKVTQTAAALNCIVNHLGNHWNLQIIQKLVTSGWIWEYKWLHKHRCQVYFQRSWPQDVIYNKVIPSKLCHFKARTCIGNNEKKKRWLISQTQGRIIAFAKPLLSEGRRGDKFLSFPDAAIYGGLGADSFFNRDCIKRRAAGEEMQGDKQIRQKEGRKQAPCDTTMFVRNIPYKQLPLP